MMLTEDLLYDYSWEMLKTFDNEFNYSLLTDFFKENFDNFEDFSDALTDVYLYTLESMREYIDDILKILSDIEFLNDEQKFKIAKLIAYEC